MKEKALKRCAHFISILLNIVCIVFGVLSVSLFAGIVVIVCARLFCRKCSARRGKLLLRQDKLLALDNAHSFSFAVLECSSVSFQPCITPKDCLDVSAKEILLLQLKQPVRYGKQHCMSWCLLFFLHSLSLKWHFHNSS